MDALRVTSRSAQRTRKWGSSLGKLLQGGEIIGLVGELGAGKTCFVRGVAEGAEVEKEAWVRSPTFTLINEYHGRLPIYHIDLYRISALADFEDLNLRDYLYSDGVSLVEWFEHLPIGEVREHLEVLIDYSPRNERSLTFTAHGGRYEELLERLRAMAA
jgi:tRNA threonylcarbamoyladenosine biosynthesis protein TsaE